jgi:hypothetical protein
MRILNNAIFRIHAAPKTETLRTCQNLSACVVGKDDVIHGASHFLQRCFHSNTTNTKEQSNA